ncbi:MAG TPA: SDR family oxidoreductase [Planctomycetota bacterium]|nr:SDR family oxidoreductase [Planctomycetota bacterium]
MDPRRSTSLGRALIVGCGYLGTRVGSLLRENGLAVTATTTRSERMPELCSLGFEAALLDAARLETSTVWTERHDAVVYCVAPGRAGDPVAAFRDGPARCLERLRESQSPPPRSFVFVSSTGVYHQRDGSWVDEESPAEPTEERHQHLRAGEEAVLAASREMGIEAASVLRLGGLYGPGRSPVEWLRRPEMRERILRGGAEAFMNWVRVEDAARAVALALERAEGGGVYLIVDGNPVRRGEFYRFAAEIARLPAPEFPSDPSDLGKRCSGRKAAADLRFAPRLPSYREGLLEL